MKLWPFSKKNETPAAARPVNPHSRKMDLPQGVVLADPSESAFQPLPSQPEATTSSVPNPTPEAESPETTTPSFADLSFIPETTQGSTVSSADKTPEKPDLTSFFEQYNLAFVSPSNPTEASTQPSPSEDKTQLTPPEPALPDFISETATPDWMSPPEFPAQDNLSPPTDSAFSFSEATSELPFTPELTNPFDFFPPELQATSEPDNTFTTDFFTIGEVPVTDTLPSDVAADFTPSTAFSPVEQTTLESPQAEAFEAPAFDTIPEATPDPILTPENFQTTEPDQAGNDSFFLYNTTGTELQPPSEGGLFDFDFAPEALTPDFQAEVEAAFLPETPTELPPQLNLPDEALAPNGEGLFFAATGIQPASDEDYAPETFGDETFDLDSLLLGESSPVGESKEAAFGPLATDTYNLGEFDPTLSENETLETDKEHYFGDEADGLKGADNPDSYDLGHYEDPDEPSMTFCLEETIETDQQLQDLVANLTEETAHPSPQAGQDLEQAQATFLQEVIAEESQSFMNMTSLPSGEDFLQSLAQPIAFDGSSAFQGSDEEGKFIQETTEEEPEPFYQEAEQEVTEVNELLAEEIPETVAPQPNLATHPPQNQPKQVFKPKPYQDSLADRIGSFEQEVLLKNSQFLSHSINDLVNSYFAQQTQEAS